MEPLPLYRKVVEVPSHADDHSLPDSQIQSGEPTGLTKIHRPGLNRSTGTHLANRALSKSTRCPRERAALLSNLGRTTVFIPFPLAAITLLETDRMPLAAILRSASR